MNMNKIWGYLGISIQNRGKNINFKILKDKMHLPLSKENRATV